MARMAVRRSRAGRSGLCWARSSLGQGAAGWSGCRGDAASRDVPGAECLADGAVVTVRPQVTAVSPHHQGQARFASSIPAMTPVRRSGRPLGCRATATPARASAVAARPATSGRSRGPPGWIRSVPGRRSGIGPEVKNDGIDASRPREHGLPLQCLGRRFRPNDCGFYGPVPHAQSRSSSSRSITFSSGRLCELAARASRNRIVSALRQWCVLPRNSLELALNCFCSTRRQAVARSTTVQSRPRGRSWHRARAVPRRR